MNLKNRIIGHDTKPADQFTANPNNHRKHGERQRRGMQAILEQIGWVQGVIENRQTGFLVDGHERIFQALAQDDNEPVPYTLIDVTPEEEKILLAVFDRLGALAEPDTVTLADLINQIDIDNALPAIQETISDMIDEYNVDLDMPEIELDEPEPGKKKTTCPNCGWEF